MKKILFLSLFLTTVVLFFQNCSNEFQALDEKIYGSEYYDNLSTIATMESDFDQKYLQNLINSEDIAFDSLNLSSFKKNLFLEEFTFFILVKNPTLKTKIDITVDQDQKTSLTFDLNMLSLVHEAPANNFSTITHETSLNSPVIIAARVGKDPKNMLFMINGEYISKVPQINGNPVLYNFLDSMVESANTDRIIIFKKTLEPAEMNVYSRHLAKSYGIASKTSISTPEIFYWDYNSTNTQFLTVKRILSDKCFSCHNSWSNLTEKDYTLANTNSKNKILVTPKSLKDSPLWYYLNGSNDENTSAPRNMPMNANPLTTSELDVIKSWILNY